MPEFVLSPAAAQDIESILAWTHEQFGLEMRVRYEALLVRAILDIAIQPDRPGSIERPEINSNARTYHLTHSKSRVKGVRRVSHPRHLLLYRATPSRSIEIGRVLHDSMDLCRHLPEDFRPK